MDKTLVVNILGGPGIGKSTLAAQLYVLLKQTHINVEYVQEYAKELVYEENNITLGNQILVFATQHHRLTTAAAHNQVIITDSPILLSTIYNPDTSNHLRNLVVEMHNKFTNINILLQRVEKTHSMIGRIHSLTESISIDNRIKSLLIEQGMDFLPFNSMEDDIKKLAKLIKMTLDESIDAD